eukprot:TRINITY_DN17078_c0_g1_i2.p1 TRINITY_DN17078_c0_g1~~TRINITY_DN17078_c0_g1_i2.p1  ORF type:complete len:762 (+),score=63.57 TRINITY_DN17078_c0_g1_i2:40-2286(+)
MKNVRGCHNYLSRWMSILVAVLISICNVDAIRLRADSSSTAAVLTWLHGVHDHHFYQAVGLLGVCAILVAAVTWYSHTKDVQCKAHVYDQENVPGDRGNGDENRSVWSLLRMWYTEDETKHRAWLTTFGLVLLYLVREATWAWLLTAFHAELTNAITDVHQTHDTKRVYSAMRTAFLWDMLWGGPLFGIIDPLFSYYAIIGLRSHFTAKLLPLYLGKENAYYHVKICENENKIDNPDQRLVEDVDRTSHIIYDLAANALSSVFGVSMWIAVLFTMPNSKMLVSVCLSAAILRTFIAWFGFRNRLVDTTINVLRTNADMRYGVIRVRDSAEEIALSGGGDREHLNAWFLYGNIVSAVKARLFVHIQYGMSMNVIQLFPPIVLWLLLLPGLVNGSLGYGDAIRIHQAYDQMAKVLGYPANNFETYIDLKANVCRLNTLLIACCSVHEKKPLPPSTESQQHAGRIRFRTASSQHALVLDEVYVSPPNVASNCLVGGLSLKCCAGESVLLMAPSGSGKTTLLRAVAGIWKQGSGQISFPYEGEDHRLLEFVGSHCYLPIGSLEQLVSYPDDYSSREGESCGETSSAENREHLEAVLRRVKMDYLIEKWGWDTVQDWKVVLSTGEQQRIGFARFFRKARAYPRNSLLLVLDEATSGMDLQTEKHIHEELRAQLLPGGSLRGFVSVSHSLVLRNFHDSVVVIGDDVGGKPEQEASPAQAELLASGTWTLPSGATLPWRHLRQPSPKPCDSGGQG